MADSSFPRHRPNLTTDPPIHPRVEMILLERCRLRISDVHLPCVSVFRARYEVNPEKINEIEKGGLEFVGRDETGQRMEIAEIPREQRRSECSFSWICTNLSRSTSRTLSDDVYPVFCLLFFSPRTLAVSLRAPSPDHLQVSS